MANDILKEQSRDQPYTEIKPFREYWQKQKSKLLGHVLRESDEEPTRQVTFLPSSASNIPLGKKRIGKPRQDWIENTKKEVYEKLHPGRVYQQTEEIDNIIYEDAMNRRF